MRRTLGGYRLQDVVSLSMTGGGSGAGVTSALRTRDPAYVLTAGVGSANADARGLVAMPNVDLAAEIVSAREAQLSYGADATIIKTADRMQKTLLDIRS